MNAKKVQKGIIFSCEEVKTFIERRTEDIASVNNDSTSYVIETTLLDAFLPKNKEVKEIVFNNLYAESPVNGENGIVQTIMALFDSNSNIGNWQAKHSNYEPLIYFCLWTAKFDSKLIDNERVQSTFLSDFKSVVDEIELNAMLCIEPYDRIKFNHRKDLSKSLYADACQSLKKIKLRSHFQLVLDCWSMLKDLTDTYKYLSGLISMVHIEETYNNRNRLLGIVDDISMDW